MNLNYYEGKLPEPVLTIQKGRPNNLGWFTLGKVWKSRWDEAGAKYEINITAGNLNRDTYEIIGTLQHEMVHYANKIADINDCNGQVHNRKFKSLAEEVGLVCEKSKAYGWGLTKCGDDLKQLVDFVIKPDTTAFEYFRQNEQLVSKKSREKKSFKYQCPSCGMVVKAGRDKRILCGECKVELEIEDED